MFDNQKSPDELRASALKAHEKSVIRLQDELDKLIKLLSWAREALHTELFSGMGYKGMAISDKDVRKLKDLTVTFDSAVGAKIRFDKAAKQMATSMTPAEEMAAVVTYIQSLEYPQRNDLQKRLQERGIWTGVNWDADRGGR